jgi:hypothetical protein
MRLRLGLILFPLFLFGAASFPERLTAADAITPDLAALLNELGVALKVTERPAWPKPRGSTVDVRLVPQEQGLNSCVVFWELTVEKFRPSHSRWRTGGLTGTKVRSGQYSFSLSFRSAATNPRR